MRFSKPWSISGPVHWCPSPAFLALLGWQPSRFLADRTEAERAFALAERLGSVNAAATQLGTN
jgi:hypothetical protein